jgi:hypothetical protein
MRLKNLSDTNCMHGKYGQVNIPLDFQAQCSVNVQIITIIVIALLWHIE